MNFKEIKRVNKIILALNLLVAAAKMSLGFFTGTLSILSDGLHSLTDGATNFIAILGIKLAEKPADEDHPYGHKKYEALTALIILFFLIIAGWETVKKIFAEFSAPVAIQPKIYWFTFAILICCMIIDAIVARYEFRKGAELESTILKADSRHTRFHYVTTGSVILGAVLIKIGLPPVVDPIIATFVVIFIGKLAIAIFKETSSVLSDKTDVDKDKIKGIVEIIEGVKSCHQIRCRGNEFLDIHLVLDSDISLEKAHEICNLVETEIKKEMPEIEDILVHAEPM